MFAFYSVVRVLAPGEQLTIQRKQSFRLITTRKFYPGQQQLPIILNGRKEKMLFELVA